MERDGAILLRKGYGFADRASHVPFAPATVVQIGSNTKDFTAVAILQLERQGRLSLRDSLGKFFAAPAGKRGPGGTPPPAPMAALLAQLVESINSGDTAQVRRYVEAHFIVEPGAPPLEERVRRIAGMRERLGTLRTLGIETFADGPVEVRLSSTMQEGVLLRVAMDRAAPYKIHGVQVQVGGPN